MLFLKSLQRRFRQYILKQCRKYEHTDTGRLGFPCDTSPHWNTIEKARVFPVVNYQIEDVKLNFPKDIHGMLTAFYGDYMTLPPVEKRKTHYPYILDFGDGKNVAG